MKKIISMFIIITFNINIVLADCVYDADSVISFKIINTGYGAKIFFSGGYGGDFIIELDGSAYTTSEIYFIKKNFCSWDSNVIVVDQEVMGVKSVTKL